MIRKLTQDDWRAYKELRLLSLQTDPDVYFSTFEEVTKWPDGNFKSEIYSSAESAFGYLGAFSPDLVGYISLAGQYFTKQKHVADVFNLYVNPDHRHQGVARSLVRALLERAKESGRVEKLFLSVMSQNTAAIALYSSLGFTIYGVKSRSLKSGETYLDETLMERSLEEI